MPPNQAVARSHVGNVAFHDWGQSKALPVAARMVALTA